MLLDIIFGILGIWVAFNFGRVFTTISIAKQIPRDLDFKITVNWFGRIKTKIGDKDESR